MSGTLAEIVASIDELAKRGKISRNRAFAAWFAINFFNLDEDEALESAAADGGNDQGIDLVFADGTTQEIVAIQAYCPENFTKTTPKNKWDAIVSSLPYLRQPEKLREAGRADLAESIEKIWEANPEFTLSVGLISLAKNSAHIEQAVRACETDDHFGEVDFFFNSQEGLVARYEALVNAEAGIPKGTLKLVGGYLTDEGDYGRAIVGSVSAVELQRLHSAHKDALFAGNIRLFLGVRKGGINEGIIRTAKDEPGKFWALNNGITIVADTAEAKEEPDGSSSVALTRFSVVNGCQTTSSLVRAQAGDDAKVLTRIIAANSKIRSDIVRFNNSQNAVRIWSVRSADEVQGRLREEFRSIGVKYAPKQEGARTKKDINTIELDKVTQFLASSQNEFLTQAISNKGGLFDQPYQKLFPKTIKAQRVYLAWLVGSYAEEARLELQAGVDGDENEDLLTVTSTYWILYCAYKLIDRFSNIDSVHLTLERMKKPEFSNAVKKYLDKGAEMYFAAAVDTYDPAEYGSIKSTLRSAKFLQKVESKLKMRVAKLKEKALPDLAAVAKSVK